MLVFVMVLNGFYSMAVMAQTPIQEKALQEWAKKEDERRVSNEIAKLEGRSRISESEWDNAQKNILLLLVVVFVVWGGVKLLLRAEDNKRADESIKNMNEEMSNKLNDSLRLWEMQRIGEEKISKMTLREVSDAIRKNMLSAAENLDTIGWDCADYISFKKDESNSKSFKYNNELNSDDVYKKIVLQHRLAWLKEKERLTSPTNRHIVIQLNPNIELFDFRIFFGFYDAEEKSLSEYVGMYLSEEDFFTTKPLNNLLDMHYFDPIERHQGCKMLYLHRAIFPLNLKYLTINICARNSFGLKEEGDDFLDSLEAVVWLNGITGESEVLKWNIPENTNKFVQIGYFKFNGDDVKFNKTNVNIPGTNPEKIGKSINVISKKFTIKL